MLSIERFLWHGHVVTRKVNNILNVIWIFLGFLELKYTFSHFLETLYFSLVPPPPFHRSPAAFSSAKPSAFLPVIERLKIQIEKMRSGLQLCLIFCLIKQTVFSSRYGHQFLPSTFRFLFVLMNRHWSVCAKDKMYSRSSVYGLNSDTCHPNAPRKPSGRILVRVGGVPLYPLVPQLTMPHIEMKILDFSV